MRWCKTFTQASTLQSSTCLYEQTAPCERSFLWRQSHTELSPDPAPPSVWQLLSLLPPGFFLFLVLWLSDSSLVSSAVTQSRKLHYKHSDKPAVATCRHVETGTSVSGTWPNDSRVGCVLLWNGCSHHRDTQQLAKSRPARSLCGRSYNFIFSRKTLIGYCCHPCYRRTTNLGQVWIPVTSTSRSEVKFPEVLGNAAIHTMAVSNWEADR